jgi:hypothetical protein
MYDIRYGSIILPTNQEPYGPNLGETVVAPVSLPIYYAFSILLCILPSPGKSSSVSVNLSQVYYIRYMLSFSFEVLIKK